MGLLNPTNADMEKAVEEHEAKYGYLDEVLYKRCIEDIQKFDLCKINKDDEQKVMNIINAFLIHWGGLRRVLNQKEGWEKRVLEIIKKNCKIIKEFQNLKLESCSLANYKEKIIELYDIFKEIVYQVGATKLLHLLSPEFFPPWDTDIRNNVKESNKKINPTGEGYYNYILEIQKLLRDNQGVWDKLTEKYKKPTKLRVIDIYLWSKTRNLK